MRTLCLSLLSSTSLLLASNALAQTIDQAGALEVQVPELLDVLFQGFPGVRFGFDGEVQAVPDGDSYDLSIPAIAIDANGNAEIDVPAFTAQVTPQANGWQRARWDFPGSVVVTNPRNSADRADITFTSTDNEMVIAPEYGMAIQADVGLSNLSVTVQGHQGDITVEGIDMIVDTEPSGEGEHSFNSETQASMDGLRIDIPTEQVLVEVDAVRLSGSSARQRLDLFANLQQRLQNLDPESEEFLIGFVEVLRASEGEKWIGDASYDMTIDDLSFTIEDVSGSLGAFGLSMTADDLDQPAATLGFSLEVDEIATTDVPPQFAQLIPTRADLDLVAADAPIEALSDQIYGYLGETPSDEELFGPKGRRAGVGNPLTNLSDIDPMEFLGILMGSEVEVVLQDFFVEAPIGHVAAEGTIRPDAQAALQATADLNLEIAGLPEMIAFAQQMGGEAAEGAAFVSVLAAMGRDGTDDEGRAVKEFDLELTQAGQVLLNGNDMSAMMGMFQ